MQELSLESVHWHVTLSEIQWPEDAVVIADKGLPASILSAFEDPILVEAGEALKTLSRVGELAQMVLDRRASRPLTLIAVGGGSVGDAVGFLASVLWRGVSLWHVPTTLLAMVDSSHGGKTAVNLERAKNQLGTFYLAERVCIVREILEHLPYAQREEGLAELIKALWLDDAESLARLPDAQSVSQLVLMSDEGARQDMFELLKRAVAVKYRVVAQDPKETLGIRTWLNLGHTVAHALELELGMSHGQSVAWGLAVMARISGTHYGLAEAHVERLTDQLEPLLYPIPSLEHRLPFARFEHLVRRDKKRIGDMLRSVILRGPAEPEVTSEVTPQQWYDALLDVYSTWSSHAILLEPGEAYEGSLEIAASKSEVNRALVIESIKPGGTWIEGPYSYAQDVVVLRDALTRLAQAQPKEEVHVHVGMGGTTLRFFLGVAAIRPGRVRVSAHPRLWARPHDELFDTLRALGATIQWDDASQQLVVDGVAAWRGGRARVRCEKSSQFASALALLGAAGQSMTITLDTDAEGGFDPELVASRTYLQMTVDMLNEVGVDATWYGRTINLNPTARLSQYATLMVYPDESSAAVWRAACALGASIALRSMPQTSRQADAVLSSMLVQLQQAAEGDEVELALHNAPDLAPVLVATAVQLPCALRITRAEHLRLKESNRIEDLVTAMAQVGIHIEATDDGIVVPFGVQAPKPGSHWPTFHDHRFVMAGCLLSMSGNGLVIEDPQVVAKSYPTFWHHVRWCGWRLTMQKR